MSQYTAVSTRHPRGDLNARRLAGAVLLVGAVVIAVLVQSSTMPRYWFPAAVGVTYLVAAAARRSRGGLWTPGIVLTLVGVTLGLWLGHGRPLNSYQLLALSLLAIGLGGVVVAALSEQGALRVSPMSLALTTLLLGAFELVDQQGYNLPGGRTVPYLALLGLWGLVEMLRPGRRD